jgi:hypothetical protein
MRTKPLGSTCRKKRKVTRSDSKGQQAMIGNGHAMGVATQIAQHLRGAAESGLSIDHPVVAVQAADEFCELLAVGESSRGASAA